MTTTISKSATEYVAGVTQQLVQIRNDLMAAMGESMHEAAEEGVQIAQARIEGTTSKTGEARQAAGQGVPGRIVDGDFQDDFTSQTYQINPNHMQSRIGWIKDDGTPIYYDVQENGSDNVGVEGVHALFEASATAAERFQQALIDYHGRNFK